MIQTKTGSFGNHLIIFDSHGVCCVVCCVVVLWCVGLSNQQLSLWETRHPNRAGLTPIHAEWQPREFSKPAVEVLWTGTVGLGTTL